MSNTPKQRMEVVSLCGCIRADYPTNIDRFINLVKAHFILSPTCIYIAENNLVWLERKPIENE